MILGEKGSIRGGSTVWLWGQTTLRTDDFEDRRLWGQNYFENVNNIKIDKIVKICQKYWIYDANIWRIYVSWRGLGMYFFDIFFYKFLTISDNFTEFSNFYQCWNFFCPQSHLSSMSLVLKEACPQSRLSSKSHVLKVPCPQCRVLNIAVLKVVSSTSLSSKSPVLKVP